MSAHNSKNKNDSLLGYHVTMTPANNEHKKFKTLLDSIKYTCEIDNVRVMQIFTHNNRSGVPTKLDTEAIGKYVKENNIQLFVHTSYVAISVFNDKRSDRVTSELNLASQVAAKGLVIHIAKHNPDEIITILKKYESEWKKYKVWLGRAIDH